MLACTLPVKDAFDVDQFANCSAPAFGQRLVMLKRMHQGLAHGSMPLWKNLLNNKKFMDDVAASETGEQWAVGVIKNVVSILSDVVPLAFDIAHFDTYCKLHGAFISHIPKRAR